MLADTIVAAGGPEVTGPPLLDMASVTVDFGDFRAIEDVSLSVQAGEIHALLGENGAGKSTLMRVLAGLVKPTAGEIRIDGSAVHLGSTNAATRLGIGMVHQHFMLVPTLTVVENVCLGLPSTGRFLPDLKSAASRLRQLAATYDLDVDPQARVEQLSVASRQRVEILKVLFRGTRILILDEPTAVLRPQETAGLFRILRRLAQDGTAIIFISHKLHEVMEIAHCASVLRRGRLVASLDAHATDARGLAHLMVGDDVALPTLDTVPATAASAGPAILEVEDLTCRSAEGALQVDRASLTIRPGEIVGLAGVDGNGQQELASAIAGLGAVTGGTIRLAGEDVTHASVARRLQLGLAHIPEDRQRTAIVESLSVRDNIVLDRAAAPGLSWHGFINTDAVAAYADRVIADYDVRAAGPTQPIGTLSGGNQQKVVLGRALVDAPALIVAVQPVRGLDIGATAFVHRQLLDRRAAGAGVLLVSTELDEILALSDRVAVMFRGRIVGELARAEVTTEKLGLMMAGEAVS
ncbi:ABC transporter ATP-binding protein [Pleomorphomonas sp. PLEO]|uniref:ABC transporter ATP-binding protein n=1 Tax=Pleomorphomonas sp. PLEO TaxID=3239306 RepID=UPI00351EB94E